MSSVSSLPAVLPLERVLLMVSRQETDSELSSNLKHTNVVTFTSTHGTLACWNLDHSESLAKQPSGKSMSQIPLPLHLPSLLMAESECRGILHLRVRAILKLTFPEHTARQPSPRPAGVNSLCLTADEGMEDLSLIWVPIHHPLCRLLMMALPKDKEVRGAQHGLWWQARDKCLCWVNWFEWL